MDVESRQYVEGFLKWQHEQRSADQLLEQVIAEKGFLTAAEQRIVQTGMDAFEATRRVRFNSETAYQLKEDGTVFFKFSVDGFDGFRFARLLYKCLQRVNLLKHQNKQHIQKFYPKNVYSN